MKTELKILVISFIIIISGIGLIVIDKPSDDEVIAFPSITSLRPFKGETINHSNPLISAYYGDTLDIDVKSVLLKVDGKDVTNSTMVTSWNVTYTPLVALEDGIHLVYLEVANQLGVIEKAVWYFFIDVLVPMTSPLNVSIEVETDRDTYALDEDVDITVRIRNNDLYNISTLYFETKHQYDLIIFDSNGTEVFNLFENFTEYYNPIIINLFPETEKTLLKKYTWNRAEKSGSQVLQGNYIISSKLLGYNASDEKKISIGEHREVYLKVMTNKNVYNIGENASIKTKLVNEMDHDLLIIVSGCGLDNPRIFNSYHRMVYEVGLACLGIFSSYLIVANSEMDFFSYKWNQTEYSGVHTPETFNQVHPDGYYALFVLFGHITTDLDWKFLDGYPPSAIDYDVRGFREFLIL
jgi:hypothetical protein